MTWFEPWVWWLAVGLGLLLIDLLIVGTGYIVWFGLGAGLTSAVVWLWPSVTLPVQLFIMALTSLACLMAWKLRPQGEGNKNALNEPLKPLIDRTVKVTSAIRGGRGQVRVNDTVWPACCDHDIDEGRWVKVTSATGTLLHVRPLSEAELASMV